MLSSKSTVYVFICAICLNKHLNINGLCHDTTAFRRMPGMITSRRSMFHEILAVGVATTWVCQPGAASAAADCYTDCMKNCKKIAPNDPEYCVMNCKEYCAQDDRKDGLSGSVSAANGEVGILGGTFGQGTVPKGKDTPPSIKLPGLDFNSDKGRQLLGYQ